MRGLLAIGLSFTVVSVALAQETKVSEHPTGTVSNISAFRYDTAVAVEPCTKDCAVPVSETRRVLCELKETPELNKSVEEWTDLALAGCGKLNKGDVAVTYIEMCRDNNGPPHFGHLYGNEMLFADGIAKVFDAVALYKHMEEINRPVGSKLNEDIIKMLHNGDVDATNKIVDFMTGTQSSDTPLSDKELKKFASKRDYANCFLSKAGFVNFNLNQKIWTCTPAASDQQLLGEKLPLNYENSNRVTSNQAAALMYLIDQDAIVSRCACDSLKAYMYRPVEQQKVAVLSGIAAGLPTGSKLISINGYTDHNYHDIGIVTLPNHKHYALAIFSKYNEYPTDFIPLLSKIVAHRQMIKTGDDEPSDYLYTRPLSAE